MHSYNTDTPFFDESWFASTDLAPYLCPWCTFFPLFYGGLSLAFFLPFLLFHLDWQAWLTEFSSFHPLLHLNSEKVISQLIGPAIDCSCSPSLRRGLFCVFFLFNFPCIWFCGSVIPIFHFNGLFPFPIEHVKYLFFAWTRLRVLPWSSLFLLVYSFLPSFVRWSCAIGPRVFLFISNFFFFFTLARQPAWLQWYQCWVPM
jgi:hypothetical protein